MKLYVINLERAQTRLERMQTIFAAHNLSFTRIKAIDGAQLDEETYKEINAVNLWLEALTHGEVACFLSHKKALETLIADKVPYGVIFEDDVQLGEAAEKILASSVWLPAGATEAAEMEIVKLETSGKKVWLGSPQPVMVEGGSLAPFTLAAIKSTHIMAAAYVISRDAAVRLLQLMQQASAPFDHFLFNFSLGNAQKFALYQLDPAIVIQADLPSTLEGARAKNKKRLKQRRSFRQTLKRELLRLVARTRTGIWGIKTNFVTADQWKRVPFK